MASQHCSLMTLHGDKTDTTSAQGSEPVFLKAVVRAYWLFLCIILILLMMVTCSYAKLLDIPNLQAEDRAQLIKCLFSMNCM